MRRHRLTLMSSVVAAACRALGFGEIADVGAFVSLVLITQTLLSSPVSWNTNIPPRTPVLGRLSQH